MLHAATATWTPIPWLALAPGVATMVTVLAFNFVGDAVRDAYDPRLRERPRA